jgi:hypothetical protein
VEDLEDADFENARPDTVDSMRQLRIGKQEDSHVHPETNIKAFDVVWVMRWFMEDDEGEDHVFYTLGTDALLTDPKPIEEVYFHGKRPYVMGYSILSPIGLLNQVFRHSSDLCSRSRIRSETIGSIT